MVWFLCLMAYQPSRVKTIFVGEQQWYYLTHSWGDKGVHTTLKNICPKVNVIARLEFELAYYHVAVQHISHYAIAPLEIRGQNRSIYSYRKVLLSAFTIKESAIFCIYPIPLSRAGDYSGSIFLSRVLFVWI